MSVNNVSTFASLQSLLQNMSVAQVSLSDDQQQISSGLKSSTFDGISSNVEQLASLNTQVTRLGSYQSGNTSIIAQMNVTNTVLGQISQLGTSVKSLIANQISGTSDPAAFSQQVQSQMNSLASLLNSTYGTNYIFGGTDITTPPVKVPVPIADNPGTPDANYYQGSGQDNTFRINDGQTITPNVRADATPFQQLFAGLRQAIDVAYSGGTMGAKDLKNAEDLVDQGTQGVIGLQSKVNSNILIVQQANTQAQSVQTYFKTVVTNLSSADVVALSAQVAQDTAVLQASFATYARISSLSLVSYLK